MKCPNPNCGYDKIQPYFNVCPKCGTPLTEQGKNLQIHTASTSMQGAREKGPITRLIAHWTYESAMADPFKFATWAYKNPNDSYKLLNDWYKQGKDTTVIRNAILEANRARYENPTVNPNDVTSSVIDATQQGSRSGSNNIFVTAVNANPTTDVAAIVRNKAIWKLQPSELARHIAPDEWQYVAEHLNGIVIEEGTSAIIYVEGEEVAQLSGGIYLFDDKHEIAADIEMQEREKDIPGIFDHLKHKLYRFFTGNKTGETTAERNARKRQIQDIIARIKRDTIIDVYLKTDRVFPAIFGHSHLPESTNGYQPYLIQSRNLDVYVGVSMQMQITNFKEFINTHMAGYKFVTIADLVSQLDNAVLYALKYQLRDMEISERGLDEYTYNQIKTHLKTNLPNLMYGVSIVEILDIATTNQDLNRFRQAESQLYGLAREYDFLKRTNEFRNRIAVEENDQKIREAANEQELRHRLDDLNKDDLLHKDELEQFVSLMMNQKAIREANNHADLDKAMMEIQRSRLVAREEFDAFNEDFNNRRFERSQVSEQLRAKSLMATALTKLEVDKTLNIANIQNVEEISEAEFEAFKKSKGREAEGWDLEAAVYGRQFVYETQKLLDEQELKRKQNTFAVEDAQAANELQGVQLEGEKKVGEHVRSEVLADHDVAAQMRDDIYEHTLKARKDDLILQEQSMNIETSHVERMSNIAMQNMKVMLEHEKDMANIDADLEKTKIAAEKTMSADQIIAKNIDTMDAQAQAEFAKSFSRINEIELIKTNAAEREVLLQQMVSMAQAHNVDIKQIFDCNEQQKTSLLKDVIAAMKDVNIANTNAQQSMVGSMVGAMQNFANTRINDVKDMKDEYHRQMLHEETRIDKTQEHALKYTSYVKVSENMPHYMAGTSVNVNVGKNVCPRCGQPLDDTMNICPVCANPLK